MTNKRNFLHTQSRRAGSVARNRSGQSLVEYTLIFLVVVVVLVIAASSIGEATSESYVETTNTIESVNAASAD